MSKQNEAPECPKCKMNIVTAEKVVVVKGVASIKVRCVLCGHKWTVFVNKKEAAHE